jgi:hypothetical protein
MVDFLMVELKIALTLVSFPLNLTQACEWMMDTDEWVQ